MAEEKVETIEGKDEEETEGTTEETQEEHSETTGAPEDDFDEVSQKEAKALYKLLKDPSTRDSTLKIMAETAGLLGKTESKEESVSEAKDFVARFKEILGPQLDFMAPKLVLAITEMLEEERKATKASLSSVEQTQEEQRYDAALRQLEQETKGLSKRLEPKMFQLADELLPGPKQTPLQYLRRLYALANAEKTATTTSRQIADKINRNSKDAPGRLQTGSTLGVRVPSGSTTKVSLRDAVQNAIDNVAKGQK